MKKLEMWQPLSGVRDDLKAQHAALVDRDIRQFLADRKGAAYRAGQFLKAVIRDDPKAAQWCRENEIEIRKASATNPNAQGGVLVPEQVAADIIFLSEAYGVTRQEATEWPMTSDNEVVPRGTSGFNVAFIAENGPGSLVQPAFDGVGLTAKKLGAFTTVSSELLEDAGEKLGLFFIKGLGRAFAKAEDNAVFNGDGTSTYAGIEGIAMTLADGNHGIGKITAQAGHNTFATLDLTDISTAVAALPAYALPNAKIYVSTTGYGATFVRLAAANGYLVADIGPDGKLRANWQGLPIVFTQALPIAATSLSGKLMLCVGDLSQAVAFGMRRDITIQWFTERYADVDQVLVRATERIDINPHDLGDNVTAGPLVGIFAP